MDKTVVTVPFPDALEQFVRYKAAVLHRQADEIITYGVWATMMNSAQYDHDDWEIERLEEIYGICHQYWEDVSRDVRRAQVIPGFGF